MRSSVDTRWQGELESKLRDWLYSCCQNLSVNNLSFQVPYDRFRLNFVYNGDQEALKAMTDALSEKLGFHLTADHCITCSSEEIGYIYLPTYLTAQKLGVTRPGLERMERLIYPANGAISSIADCETAELLFRYLNNALKRSGLHVSAAQKDVAQHIILITENETIVEGESDIIVYLRLGCDVSVFLEILNVQDKPQFYILESDYSAHKITIPKASVEALLKEELEQMRTGFMSRVAKALSVAFSTPQI